MADDVSDAVSADIQSSEQLSRRHAGETESNGGGGAAAVADTVAHEQGASAVVTNNGDEQPLTARTDNSEDAMTEASTVYSNMLDWRRWRPGPWNRFARYETRIDLVRDKYSEKVRAAFVMYVAASPPYYFMTSLHTLTSLRAAVGCQEYVKQHVADLQRPKDVDQFVDIAPRSDARGQQVNSGTHSVARQCGQCLRTYRYMYARLYCLRVLTNA